MGRLINIDSLKGCAIIRPTRHETIEHIKQCGDDCLNHDDIPTAYNNGWIPCSERLPGTNDAVNITWVNRNPVSYYKDIKNKPFTATGHYHNGKWYWYSCVCKDYLDEYGDSCSDKVNKDIKIIAWQPLPAP